MITIPKKLYRHISRETGALSNTVMDSSVPTMGIPIEYLLSSDVQAEIKDLKREIERLKNELKNKE